eukprot:6185022-Pleurochrysis_carterae.AAC.1
MTSAVARAHRVGAAEVFLVNFNAVPPPHLVSEQRKGKKRDEIGAVYCTYSVVSVLPILRRAGWKRIGIALEAPSSLESLRTHNTRWRVTTTLRITAGYSNDMWLTATATILERA